MTDSYGATRGEVLRRIGIARSCINGSILERRIWKSSIRLETKLRVYQTYILPVLMYVCETWVTTKYLLSRLDNRRLRLFGHIACSSRREDHHRAIAVAI